MKDTAGRERRAAARVELTLEDAINLDGAITHGWKPDAAMMDRLRTAIDVGLRSDATDAASAAAGSVTIPLEMAKRLYEGAVIADTPSNPMPLDEFWPLIAAAESAEASGEGRA